MINKHYKVIIIGGGPAGCAAAIQLKRNKIDATIIEKEKIGGLAKNANYIENYLGFPAGISGSEFSDLLQQHLEKLNVEIITDEISHIIWNKPQTTFVLESINAHYSCQYLIIAIGTHPKKLKVKGEQDLAKESLLFYEPSAIPNNLLQNKNVAIIGGGDAAFDYALNLAGKGNKVVIIHRHRAFKCLPVLHERVVGNGSIKLRTFLDVKEFEIKENESKSAIIRFKQNEELIVDYVVVAIGREQNKVPTEQKLTRKQKGSHLFLIGDFSNKSYRQIAIATGEGIKTAMEITGLLTSKNSD